MAEFVQKCIEEMLPELEQMQRVDLFTSAETRSILKKRKAFEYKLRRRIKEKSDYLQYAQYEMNTLALVKKRREKKNYNFKKEEIDFAILRRIHKIFTMACYRFQDDVKLWLTYIDFTRKQQEKDKVSKLLTRMLQVHSKKPELWVMAAKWEMEDSGSMDNARSLLQQGLRFNKENKQLWHEYFRMELLNAEKLRKRKEILTASRVHHDSEETSDAVQNGKVAEVVYLKAMETFPDIKFGLGFVKISELFGFTKLLIDTIMQHLENLYGQNEWYLDMAARRIFHEAGVESAEMNKKQRGAYLIGKEMEAWNVYEKAIEVVPSGLMWQLYLDACLERLNLKGGPALGQNRLEQTLGLFSRAADAGHMDEAHFLSWIEVLQKTGQPMKAAQVVERATSRCPKSVVLWKQHLLVAIMIESDLDTVKNLLDSACKTIKGQESLPLWEIVFQWSIVSHPEAVSKLFEKAVLHCNCAEIKELYLDYAGKTESIGSVRNLFQRLSSSKPHSLDLFAKFISIESAQAKPKMSKLRIAYEQAISEYGNESVDVWLEYMKLESEHPNGQAENVSTLHWRAMRALDGSLTEKFVALYSLRQNGLC